MLRIALSLLFSIFLGSCTHLEIGIPEKGTDSPLDMCLSVILDVQQRHLRKEAAYTDAEIKEYVTDLLSPRLAYLKEAIRPIVEASFKTADVYIRSGKRQEEIIESLAGITLSCRQMIHDKMQRIRPPKMA